MASFAQRAKRDGLIKIFSPFAWLAKRDGLIKMYTVYVLKSLKDKRTYVGCSKNLSNRIKQHNSGQVHSTKTRVPFVLWYKEEYVNKYEAFKREWHFKTSWGRRQLRKILNDLPNLNM